MDFSFDMYFRQFWNDPRLVFEPKGWVNKLIISGEDKFVKVDLQIFLDILLLDTSPEISCKIEFIRYYCY